MSELLKILPQVKGSYRENTELKNWFNIATKAEILFRPFDVVDLQEFLQKKPKNIAITILGAASNVIIKDGGIKGVTIRLPAQFAKISHNEDLITIGAGCLCGNAALYSKNAGIANLEFLTGIPGSIGGAIAMNAGCYGSDISQILVSAKAIDFDGNLIELKNSDFDFYYRGNKITKTKNLIFIEATFKGVKSTVDAVATKIADFNKKREEAQPIRAKTGGSTFKNPNPLDPDAKKAWQLIDEAGFRGASEGDAQISEKHCNFMINRGQALAKNLIDLGNRVKKSVKDKTGVDLEWEIKILGED